MSQRFKNVFLKVSPLFIDYISWIISYSESINFSPPSHSNKGTNVGICGYTQGNKWRRKWQPTPVLLPGKLLGWGSLVGYSPWGRKELDTTDRLHFLSFYSSFWRRKWQPTPVFLPGKPHGQRGLVGYSLWGCKESFTTKQLTSKLTQGNQRQMNSSLWRQHINNLQSCVG